MKNLFLILLLSFSLSSCLTRIPAISTQHYEQDFVNDPGMPRHGGIKVTSLGVSTLLIDDGQSQLLIDGFFSRFGLFHYLTQKIRTDTAAVQSMIDKHDISRLKAIFVTHSHFDHAMDAPYVAQQTGAMLHGSASTLAIGRGAGLEEEQMQLFEAEEEIEVGEFSIQVIPSLHAPIFKGVNDMSVNTIEEPLSQPGRGEDYLMGGAFDFLIRHKDKSIYIRPSANYQQGQLATFRADVFFMGIAGMTKVEEEGFVDTYYQETVGHLQPALVIPIHWDNFFRPYKEGNLKFLPWIYEPSLGKGLDRVRVKLASKNIRFKMLQGGSGIVLFDQ